MCNWRSANEKSFIWSLYEWINIHRNRFEGTWQMSIENSRSHIVTIIFSFSSVNAWRSTKHNFLLNLGAKVFFLLFSISIEQMFAFKNTNWMHTVQRKQYLQHVIISVYVFSHLVILFVLKIITFLGWNINGFCVKNFCFYLLAFTNNA